VTPETWFSEMRDIWLNNKPDSISELLSNELNYYEDPLGDPLTSIESVVSAWQGIKGQKFEYVDIKMLHENDNIGIALWKSKSFDQPERSGAYYLELNDNGKCKEFRRWWHTHTE
jgi:hypothetical protein